MASPNEVHKKVTTVDLLTRYVTWKLRENDSARFDVATTASHQFA
jgi:hypothetical protein